MSVDKNKDYKMFGIIIHILLISSPKTLSSIKKIITIENDFLKQFFYGNSECINGLTKYGLLNKTLLIRLLFATDYFLLFRKKM